MKGWVLSLLLIPSAWGASPSAMLAPSQPELVERLTQLRAKLERADAIGVALARLQNQMASAFQQGALGACANEALQSLTARSRVFGFSYRDAVQAVRADADRLSTLLAAPSLGPLLQDEDRRAAEALLARSEHHARRYQEALAWQQRFVQPSAKHCALELASIDGVPAAGPTAPEETTTSVAVIGIGPGYLCPGGLDAGGQVQVIGPAKACYAPGPDCACEARPILPGAVLGP